MKPCIFIDRDDTIIHDVPYLAEPSRVALTPGAAEALAEFRGLGFSIIVISNQSGIGRGYFTEAQLKQVNDRMLVLLAEGGASIDAIYYCPHRPDENCNCRKPKTGMLEQACRDFEVDKAHSVMIGDLRGDVDMGKSFGIKTIQIMLPDKAKQDAWADFKVATLPECTPILTQILRN
ncbi:MAG: HAD family hydrolase [Victivallales bacterium]|nr:HAD family hydrolase [Victivallales bacterium]